MLTAIGMIFLTGALALVVRAWLAGTPTGGDGHGMAAVAVSLGLLGSLAAGVRLWLRPPAEDTTGDGHPEDGSHYRRAARYQLIEPAPERVGDDYPLAGQVATTLLARAETVARDEGRPSAGIESIRPPLRELLRDILVAGGLSTQDAERAIDEGTWTDDPLVAAVFSPALHPPAQSVRARLRGWLRPERVVRERLDRAVGAVVALTDEVLPQIPGMAAPRRVRVRPPTLDELRRDVDGSLRPAAEPTPTRRPAVDHPETATGPRTRPGDRDTGNATPGEGAEERQ